MASNPVDDLPEAMKDLAYVSVGLGVLAFQRVQVRRQEIRKAISGPADEARGTIEVLGALVGERVKMIEERLGSALKH